jgi:hypothetical protein
LYEIAGKELRISSCFQECKAAGTKAIFASLEPIMGGGRPTFTVYDATRSYWEDGCPIEGRAREEPEDEGEVFDWVEVIE